MSAGYLLDTNICVHFLRGEYRLNEKLAALGLAQCFVSEITIAEPLFGAANSAPVWQARQHQQVAEFSPSKCCSLRPRWKYSPTRKQLWAQWSTD